MQLFRGEKCSREVFVERIAGLRGLLAEDLALPILDAKVVIDAVDRLVSSVSEESVFALLNLLGVSVSGLEAVLSHTLKDMKREALTYKLETELSRPIGEWRKLEDPFGNETHECDLPLGVLMHIGARNTVGLSAYSVIEGLLTGNINILKLPESEAGLSYYLLEQLIQIEPRLKPYIYVTDLPSSETEVLLSLAEVSDAVVVWGGDTTIKALRGSLPAHKPIIEWGHKISFAYFSECETTEADLRLLAEEICVTNQLYCSSPQCVFYESEEDIKDFANRLAAALSDQLSLYPPVAIDFDRQAEITFLHQTIKIESALKGGMLITDTTHDYGVMVSEESELKPSPLYRNIWVVPVKRSEIIKVLRPHIGHLQTVGLSAAPSIKDEIETLLYKAGVTKITSCGAMYLNKLGESHDGKSTLSQYVKKVNWR